MSNKLYNLEVNDRQSFIQFLELLEEDFQTNKKDWENDTLERFLEALKRYTQDVQGYYENTKQNIHADAPSWKVFADILKGAKVYE